MEKHAEMERRYATTVRRTRLHTIGWFMSLKQILDEKRITKRKELLSLYLRNHTGELDDNETTHFKHIFAQWYEPDDTDTKFYVSDISSVRIRGNNCFQINVNNVWYPTSIKRLSGSNVTPKICLTRALRNAIEPQIMKYRLHLFTFQAPIIYVIHSFC